MNALNQTQFAKHIGVSKGYVTQLKQAGRIVMTQDGLVDVEASESRIKETEDANRDDVKARHAAARGSEKAAPAEKKQAVKDVNHVTFSEGRAKEQHYKSLQAELEYQRTIGELVPKADMQAAVADVVTTFRQALENMPHRISAELVGKDIDFIRSALKQECHQVLGELAREFAEKIAMKEAESV